MLLLQRLDRDLSHARRRLLAAEPASSGFAGRLWHRVQQIGQGLPAALSPDLEYARRDQNVLRRPNRAGNQKL